MPVPSLRGGVRLVLGLVICLSAPCHCQENVTFLVSAGNVSAAALAPYHAGVLTAVSTALNTAVSTLSIASVADAAHNAANLRLVAADVDALSQKTDDVAAAVKDAVNSAAGGSAVVCAAKAATIVGTGADLAVATPVMLRTLLTDGPDDACACVILHLSSDPEPSATPDLARDLTRIRNLVRLARTCTAAYAAVHHGPTALLPHPQCFHWLQNMRTDDDDLHLADHSFRATVRTWVEADEAHYTTTGTATPQQAALVPLQRRFRVVVYVVIFAVFGAGKRPPMDARYLAQLAGDALSGLQAEVTRVPVFWAMFNAFLDWARRLAWNHGSQAQRVLAAVDRAACPPALRYGRAVSGNSGSRFHLEEPRDPYRGADFAWRRACTCALLRLFARQVAMPDQDGPLAAQWRWWKRGLGAGLVWGDTGVRCMDVHG